MKKFLLSILTIILATVSYGQEIKFQKTFDETLNLASKEKKPVFVLLTANQNRQQDNLFVTFKSGISSRNVVDFYNKKFINFTTGYDDTTVLKITSFLNPEIFPCYVFLDYKGQVIYTNAGNYASSQKFVDIAKEALNRIASGHTLKNYDQLNSEGKLTTRQQLKDYITLREEFGIYDNHLLIEKYVNFLNVSELDDYNQALFILKSGPIAYDKAYRLAYINQKTTDSIYKKESAEVRIALYSRSVTNTLNEAIRTRNATLAENSASLLRMSWNKDYKSGYKAYSAEMLSYYKAVADTANFYGQAQYYYDNYYMNINADSAKKIQNEVFQRLAKTAQNTATQALGQSKTPTSSYTVLTKTPQTMEIAGILNNAAWDFYTLGTHNTNYLIKALLWSRRSIELQPIYNYYDTMAHIMYRLNFYDEALLNQQKAIDMATAASGSPEGISNLNAELSKMRAHTL